MTFLEGIPLINFVILRAVIQNFISELCNIWMTNQRVLLGDALADKIFT